MEPLVIKRVMPCSKRQLFDAWAKPSVMARWFFASQTPVKNSTVRNSFTVGGSYNLTMHLKTGEYTMSGEYKEINRYNRITFTWSSHIIEHSLVQLDFRELSPNRTEMILTQTRFPSDEVRASHDQGWSGCLDSLERFVTAEYGEA
ncbi:SRPBCC family protein [Kordiimonas sp.]|uniref:SRPBCC family protein n=1 Tax=Kordiimonas sp. TaxID=1970157 RepID=UPI003A940070